MMSLIAALAREVLALFIEMAPYLLLGLTVAGVLSVVMRTSFVARHVGRPGIGAVIKASILGVPLPLCSCGVVPTASYLKRAGASKPAVMSFLISTPQTGVDSIAATWGMLGPVFAIFRPIAAFAMGIVGGMVSVLSGGRDSTVSESRSGDDAAAVEADDGPRTLREKVRSFAGYAYGEAIDDIAVQFLFGLVVGGLISLLIPADFFTGRSFGSGLPAMLLMVLVGIPMYVCSTSSIPIAVALIAKGLSPGAAYVFLVAGPATNAATLAVLARVLGRRQTGVYVAVLIVGSLIFGPVMETVTGWFGWTPPAMVAGHMESLGLPDYLLSGALAILIAAALVRRWRPAIRRKLRRSRSDDRRNDDGALRFDHVSVEGMTCTHCAATVREAISRVDGVSATDVDVRAGTVRLQGVTDQTTLDAVAAAVREAGYTLYP